MRLKTLFVLGSLTLLTSCAYQAGYFDDIEQAKKKPIQQQQGAAPSGPQNVAPQSDVNTGATEAAKTLAPVTNF